MKLKVFNLRLDPATEIFNDKELTDFQLGKDILEVSEHFLIHDKIPTLVLVLRYREIVDLRAHPLRRRSRTGARNLMAKGRKFMTS